MHRTALGVLTLWLAVAACSGSTKDSDPSAGAAAGAQSSGGSAGNGSGGKTNGGSSSAGSSSAGSSSAGSSSAGSSSAGAPNWQEWAACAADEDCTVVKNRTCCGCFPMGVNKEHEAEANAASAAFNPSQCPPLGCASPPCAPDSMVACEEGVCTPKPGCSERTEQDCESDEKCQEYQARLCTNAATMFAYFTCGKPKGACDQALTCVVDPAGRQVQFPDSCVPDGYTQACPGPCP
jgi:hypothetical protein